jgi:hypothetical protein
MPVRDNERRDGEKASPVAFFVKKPTRNVLDFGSRQLGKRFGDLLAIDFVS